MTETNWLPGILVLMLGMIGAVGYLLLSRKRGAPAPSTDPVTDLDCRAQRLLDQIKELEADRHHLDHQQFAAEKHRLEREAAAALRQRDAQAQRLAAPAPRAPKPAARETWLTAHPQLKGAMWGGGGVLFFVLLGLFLNQEQKPRTQGREMTGRTPGRDSNPREEDDPRLKAMMARLTNEPDNVELMGEISHEMINQQQWDAAAKLTGRALGVDPFSVENRIHRAFLKAVRGDMDGSARELEHLANYYPNAQEALLFLGLISMQQGNLAKALEKFEQFSVEVPTDQQPPQLQQAISSLRKQVGARK